MTKTLENCYYCTLESTKQAKKNYRENPTRENELKFEKQKEIFGEICVKVIVELLKEQNENKLKIKGKRLKKEGQKV